MTFSRVIRCKANINVLQAILYLAHIARNALHLCPWLTRLNPRGSTVVVRLRETLREAHEHAEVSMRFELSILADT